MPCSRLCRPDSQPVLSIGLAMDNGFIWQLKWCPAGAWQSPGCAAEVSIFPIHFSGRLGHSLDTIFQLARLCLQPPHMPRLGLLAVATSSSVVKIYSVPHPEALHATRKQDNSGEKGVPLFFDRLRIRRFRTLQCFLLTTRGNRFLF